MKLTSRSIGLSGSADFLFSVALLLFATAPAPAEDLRGLVVGAGTQLTAMDLPQQTTRWVAQTDFLIAKIAIVRPRQVSSEAPGSASDLYLRFSNSNTSRTGETDAISPTSPGPVVLATGNYLTSAFNRITGAHLWTRDGEFASLSRDVAGQLFLPFLPELQLAMA